MKQNQCGVKNKIFVRQRISASLLRIAASPELKSTEILPKLTTD